MGKKRILRDFRGRSFRWAERDEGETENNEPKAECLGGKPLGDSAFLRGKNGENMGKKRILRDFRGRFFRLAERDEGEAEQNEPKAECLGGKPLGDSAFLWGKHGKKADFAGFM